MRKAKRRDGKGLRDFQKLSVGTINILHKKINIPPFKVKTNSKP